MTSSSTTSVPSDNPESYCRLCFSTTQIRVLNRNSKIRTGYNLVTIIDHQLGIALKQDAANFPCGLCHICEEKLEELHLCNADGLLDQDEDLMEYKASCVAADEAVRKKRRKIEKKAEDGEDKRVALPFHKLNDGRYKCNVCPDAEFEFISSCIKHYQDVHPDSTLGGISTEPAPNSAIRGEKRSFNCVSCPEKFDNIDALIRHREKNHQRVKKRQPDPPAAVDRTKPVIVEEGDVLYYQCIVCSAVIGGVLSLLEHRQLHVLDPSTQTVVTWLGDSANVTPTNGFKCPYCIEQFVDSKIYYFHMNAVHDKRMCDVCGYGPASSSSKLLVHQRNHRTNTSGALACDLCPMLVSTQAELDDHYLQHQTLIPIEAEEAALPPSDECYFLDEEQANDECILSDQPVQNGDCTDTKVVEISDDEDE